MRVSAGLPTGMEGLTYPIPFSDPENVIRIALAAEKFGYDSVWGNDHMTTQHYVRDEFPVPPRFWEPLITYAYLASITKKLRFGTGILVMPMRRDLVVTAKQICTLDHFSGGRLELGLGIGAYREEFSALQPHTSMQRGDILDEGLKAITQLFTQRVSSFEGKFYNFKDVELWPKPLQKRMPILIGGNNANNIRRVVEFGTGWIPAGLHVSKVNEGMEILRKHAESMERDWRDFDIAPQFIVRIDKNEAKAKSDFQSSQMYKHLLSLRNSTLKNQGAITMEESNLIGTPAQIIDKVQALKAAGVTHLLGLYFAANSIDNLVDQMQLFAEEVIPHIL